MRQTSEQFADAMLKDIESETPKQSFAEQLAEMEKRINDKIAQTQDNIFARMEQASLDAPADATADEPADEETIEPVENENEGE